MAPEIWMSPSDAESRVSKTNTLAGHTGSWHRGPVVLPSDALDFQAMLGFLICLETWLSYINGNVLFPAHLKKDLTHRGIWTWLVPSPLKLTFVTRHPGTASFFHETMPLLSVLDFKFCYSRLPWHCVYLKNHSFGWNLTAFRFWLSELEHSVEYL